MLRGPPSVCDSCKESAKLLQEANNTSSLEDDLHRYSMRLGTEYLMLVVKLVPAAMVGPPASSCGDKVAAGSAQNVA